MRRVRIFISGGTTVIAFSALVLAALRTASDIWFSALYTATFILLLVAIVAAFIVRGGERAFWFGLAVFGWGFFLLGLGPWVEHRDGYDMGRGHVLNRGLLTSRAVLSVVPRLRKQERDWGEIDRITSNTMGVGHVLMTVGIALIGGTFATLMRWRRSRPLRAGRVGNPLALRWVTVGLAVTAGAALTANVRASRTAAFPPGSFLYRHRYSKYLSAMSESHLPVLAARDHGANVCRFLWLPTFDHPVAVRIDRLAHGATGRAVVLNYGTFDTRTAPPAIDRAFTISEDQWIELERQLQQIGFAGLPTIGDGPAGFDGDRCIIEHVKDGTYHVVDRWCPRGAYRKLCQHILDLGGLNYQHAQGDLADEDVEDDRKNPQRSTEP